jgi:hypothetical protein
LIERMLVNQPTRQIPERTRHAPPDNNYPVHVSSVRGEDDILAVDRQITEPVEALLRVSLCSLTSLK